MDIRKHRGLIALNAILLGALALVTLQPAASAQSGRARGEYTMVAGQIQGGNSNAVYITDAANQELVVVRWDETRKELQGLGYRDLSADAKANPGR